MEEIKKEAIAGTTATDELHSRLEQLSLSYCDFLERLLQEPETVTPEVVHALNDCIRTLHHLKKINNQMISHS